MPEKIDLSNVSIEEFLMGISSLEEELTTIPAYLLHGPYAQKQTKMKPKVKGFSCSQGNSVKGTSIASERTKIESQGFKRKKNGQVKEVQQLEDQTCFMKVKRHANSGHQLPQDKQGETSRTLLDISNSKVNLQGTMNPVVRSKHNDEEHSAFIEDTSSCAGQNRTSITERRGGGRGRGRGRGGRERVDKSMHSEILEVYRLPESVLVRKSSRPKKNRFLTDYEYDPKVSTETRYFCEETPALQSVCSVKAVSSSQQTSTDDRASRKDDNHSESNSKQVKSSHQGRQHKTQVPMEAHEDIEIRQSGRIRKGKHTDTSQMEPRRKAPRRGKIIPDKDEEQESGSKKTAESPENLLANGKRSKENIENYHDKVSTEHTKKDKAAGESEEDTSGDEVRLVKRPRRTRKISESLKMKNQATGDGKQNAGEDIGIKEFKKTRQRPKRNPKPSEKKNPTTGEDNQSTTEDVDVTVIEKATSRSRKNLKSAESVSNVEAKMTKRKTATLTTNQDPNTTEPSSNIQLRRSTRERKIKYVYGEDSYVFHEGSGWTDPFPLGRKQKTSKSQKSSTNPKKAKKNTAKQTSKKLTLVKTEKQNDSKLRKKAVVCLKRLKNQENSSAVGSQKEAEKHNVDDGGSAQKRQSVRQKKGKKVTQSAKSNEEQKEKTQAEGVQSAEDLKITAKKGTLKYLQQREKYIKSMGEAAQVDDDFSSGNPIFAKKKFKLSNIMSSSLEETLAIVTPKRNKKGGEQGAAITPRTALLGKLQPLTPSTTPYSPFPTLDTKTKKCHFGRDALRHVYQVTRGKKRQHQRGRKLLHSTTNKGTAQRHPFTTVEFPAYQEGQSGNASDTSHDEYFNDTEEL